MFCYNSNNPFFLSIGRNNKQATSIEAAACDIGFTRVDDISILGTRTIEASKLVTTQQTSGLGIKARIARKKTGCKSGFGLCDFRALQSQDNILRLQTRTQNFIRDNHECFTQCVIDSTGNGVAFFLLAKSPESKGLTSEMMPLFYVDEDIEQPIEETPDYSLFCCSRGLSLSKVSWKIWRLCS